MRNKKIIAYYTTRVVLCLLMMIGLILFIGKACKFVKEAATSSIANQSVASSNNQSSSSTVSQSAASTSSTDITELKQGDAVSIIGQVASSILLNGNTLWVQVKQTDNTFVIYHCQFKQEWLESISSYNTLDVVKIKGAFSNLIDLEQENTMPIISLYDCELL